MWKLIRFVAFALIGAALSIFTAGGVHSAERSVSIGYLPVPGPWLAAMGDGAFERETGYTIKWVRFDTGAQAIQAMLEGKVQLTYAGSTPIAVGLSGGVDMELFLIAADIGFAEALILRRQNRVLEPLELLGKRIATPFWSTSHYHLMFALEQLKFTDEQTDIYNMTPDEIIAAWHNGMIDAAYLWLPYLAHLFPTGQVLLWSDWLSRWGRPTFDGFVVDRRWSHTHPEFMTKFVKMIEAANSSYRLNPELWTAATREVQTIAKILDSQSDIVAMLATLRLPTLLEQLSPNWLGGGTSGSAARTLLTTSRFLQGYNMVRHVHRDYSAFVSTRWVKEGLFDRPIWLEPDSGIVVP